MNPSQVVEDAPPRTPPHWEVAGTGMPANLRVRSGQVNAPPASPESTKNRSGARGMHALSGLCAGVPAQIHNP